jgi:hypothetical protein
MRIVGSALRKLRPMPPRWQQRMKFTGAGQIRCCLLRETNLPETASPMEFPGL